jgi:hypothetical protein
VNLYRVHAGHIRTWTGELEQFAEDTGAAWAAAIAAHGRALIAAATGSFSGTVSGRALLARNPDGSCSFTQVPRLEVDKFAESGTLSF